MINKNINLLFRGIVHYISKNIAYASRNNFVYYSNDDGLSWVKLFKIPISFLNTLKSVNRLSRRLFRMGIFHIIKTETNFLVIFAFGNIYQYNLKSNELFFSGKIQGKRPLCICYANGIIYYGEYFSNIKRRNVRIFGSCDSGKTWMVYSIFKNIRHIHGIFFDNFTNCIWITTGDYNEEIGIWCSHDNLNTFKKVFSNSQQVRAIQLLFTKKYIYFGSDTPLEVNHIYRFLRTNFVIEKLQKVGGVYFLWL